MLKKIINSILNGLERRIYKRQERIYDNACWSEVNAKRVLDKYFDKLFYPVHPRIYNNDILTFRINDIPLLSYIPSNFKGISKKLIWIYKFDKELKEYLQYNYTRRGYNKEVVIEDDNIIINFSLKKTKKKGEYSNNEIYNHRD